MLRLYRLFLPLGLIALAPYYLIRGLRHGKYLAGLRQRFGFDLPAVREGTPRIWVHAVSVGEVLAVEPLLRKLLERHPGTAITLSTTTAAGQQVARQRLDRCASVLYFPIDMKTCVMRSWRHIKPDIVLLAETELWPNFIEVAAQHRAPVFLINARLSDRSFRHYRLIRRSVGKLLNKLELVMAQTSTDADRFRRLGCADDRIMVAGNLKYDAPPPDARGAETREAVRGLGANDATRIWIAGSTTEGEEPIILEVFERLRHDPAFGELLLILAPRHPERFDAVAELLVQSGAPFIRRSQATSDGSPRPVAVVLLDTIGELASLYAMADLVFIGGSLQPKGGHNIIEPARFGKPIIVGPHMENFRTMVEEFEAAGGLIRLASVAARLQADELTEVASELLGDPAWRADLGGRAKACAEKSRGALDRVLSVLGPYIAARRGAPELEAAALAGEI